MTDYVLMPAADYQNICDAVREKTGGTTLLRSGELAENIAKISARNAFWERFQDGGNKRNYYQAFGNNHWSDITYDPIYDIFCDNSSGDGASNMFYNARMITNTKVGIHLSNTPATNMFTRCGNLETIPLLQLEGVESFSGCFTGCSKLRQLTISGSVNVNCNISATPVLSEQSVQSVIDHLKDLTGANTQTLTLHNTVGSCLTDAQKAAITAKNWTLAY